MKIALCTPVDLRALAFYLECAPETLPGGMGSTAVTPLAAALLDRGHQVTLFTLSTDVEVERVVRGSRLSAFIGPLRQAQRARNLWKNEIDYLARAIRREQPAFVHAHWTYEFAMGALQSGSPVLVTIHDLPWNVLRYFHDPYRAARVVLAYRVALHGRRYTAVSSDAARHFLSYFSPGAQISVVPNFLSEQIFAMYREVEPRSPRPVTFYTVLQGWTNRKNGKAALQAFALARRRLPAARMLMMGADHQQDGPAHSWAREQGIDAQVEFRGPLAYRKMLATVLEEGDILVHPSLDESFSMAALEAMALRKPVIAGRRTPGVREVLEFGRCGLLADVRRPSDIATAMVRLGTGPDLCATMAATAYASAYERFRVDPVLDAYESLYAGLSAAPGCACAETDSDQRFSQHAEQGRER